MRSKAMNFPSGDQLGPVSQALEVVIGFFEFVNAKKPPLSSKSSPVAPHTALQATTPVELGRVLMFDKILSGNRNFDGRIHPYAKQAFLASPPLVVAYAIAGTIRFDIEKDVLGIDPDGNPVTLKDLWPSDEEIDQCVKQSVKPEQFRAVYDPMFMKVTDSNEKTEPLYAWRPQSTYIRRPPYWEGALAKKRTMRGLRPLAVLGDNITTDHLSPSNAILASSAAGEYLAKMGLPEEDFNSYATHRGDHLTAQRAGIRIYSCRITRRYVHRSHRDQPRPAWSRRARTRARHRIDRRCRLPPWRR